MYKKQHFYIFVTVSVILRLYGINCIFRYFYHAVICQARNVRLLTRLTIYPFTPKNWRVMNGPKDKTA